MVWAIHVETAGQRQADSFLITVGKPGKQREITVGRPPAKADTRPDIVVPEKSVSKIHAVLHASTSSDDGNASSRLIIADRSRFGTTINGRSMAKGGSEELRVGDRVQLAPKAFLRVEDLPVVLAVHPAHPQLGEVREAAARAGVRLTHSYDPGMTTHVLYDPGDVAWSAVVRGALRGGEAPFVGMDWLFGVAAAGLLTNTLPGPPEVPELLVGPTQRARVPLPPPSASCRRGLLDGFTFGFSDRWQDPGLAALLEELGGRVAPGPQGMQLDDRAASATEVVLLLHEGDHGAGGGGGSRAHIDVEHLLMCLLTADVAVLRQLVASACGSTGAAGAGRPGAPVTRAPEPSPADSDMTEADDEEAVEGEVVEQRPASPGAGQGQPSRPRAGTAHVNCEAGSGSRGGDAAAEAAGCAGTVDCWLSVARRPEDANAQASAVAATTEVQAEQPIADPSREDAPPPKRRRLTAAAGAAAGASTNAEAASASTLPAELNGRLMEPTPAHMPALPLLRSPAPVRHEAADDAPWLTSQPQGHSAGAANRRSGSGLRRGVAAIAIKEDPEPAAAAAAGTRSAAPKPTTTATTGITMKGKGKAGIAAADDLGLLPVARVKDEALQQPELLDASAQVVLEADLFAPTPEQPPPRCRSGSAEPYHSSVGAGGVGGSVDDRHTGLDAEMPDYKQFRKQSGQLPHAAVQPLPVVLVDNFQRPEEAEVFFRLEEERANNKRRADEMFKTAGVGAKKPTRAARRT